MPTSRIFPSWPRGAYVAIAAILALCAGAVHLVYAQTRDSYRAVGFNDGSIAERQQIVERLEKIAVVGDCRELAATAEVVEFVTVKADVVYLARFDDRRVQFCRYRAADGLVAAPR